MMEAPRILVAEFMSLLRIADSLELCIGLHYLTKTLLNGLPVDHLPDGLEVFCLAVLVLEAVG